jgi:hypothetical protein
VDLTRQGMYGDLLSELKNEQIELEGNVGIGTPFDKTDPYPEVPVSLKDNRPTSTQTLRQIRQEMELRYQRARGVGAEARRLQELKSLDPKQVTPELEAEMSQLQQSIDQAPTTVTSPEGTRVVIPRPGTADNDMLITLEMAGRDTLRGLAGLSGALNPNMTAEEGQELIAEIRDESTAVNIGAETLQLAAAGFSGAAIVAKGLTKIAVATPKIRNAVAAIVGAPAGEATVATTGTGTLTGADEGQDVLEKKLRVLSEGALFGFGVEGLVKGVKTVADISISIPYSSGVAICATR